MDILEVVGQVGLFDGLDEAQQQEVAKLLTEKHWPAETLVMTEGEPGDAMYVLCEGRVEVSRTLTLRSATGSFTDAEKSFNVLDGGSRPTLGEIAVVDENATRSATVRTLTECVVLEFTGYDFEKLVKTDPEIGCKILRNILRIVCDLLRKSNNDILKLTTALSIALGK